jgi:hypothetical protein
MVRSNRNNATSASGTQMPCRQIPPECPHFRLSGKDWYFVVGDDQLRPLDELNTRESELASAIGERYWWREFERLWRLLGTFQKREMSERLNQAAKQVRIWREMAQEA